MEELSVVVFGELYNFVSPIFAKLEKLEDEAKEALFEAQQIFGLDESSKKMFEKMAKTVLSASTPELFHYGINAVVDFLSRVVVDPEVVINEESIRNVYLSKMIAISEQKKVENKQITEFGKKLAKRYALTKHQLRALKKIAKFYFKGKDLSALEEELKEEFYYIIRVIENKKSAIK